ncbi:MAG: PASTA domain-containing protein, partial [Actinobacteria bacterium]
SQDPPPGEQLKEGGTFKLVVSLGPTPVGVPDLTGLSDGQAGEALAAQGLVVGTVTEVNDEVVPAHFVISWEPAGQEIPKGNPVNLVVSKGPAPRVVPEVGGSYDNAAAALAGVQLKATPEEVFSDTVPAGEVVGTVPGAGESIERDAVFTVQVAKGPDLVGLPSVSGLSLQEAIGAIESAGLTPGQLYGPARGTPISTNPAEGAQVKRGSAVDIYLG